MLLLLGVALATVIPWSEIPFGNYPTAQGWPVQSAGGYSSGWAISASRSPAAGATVDGNGILFVQVSFAGLTTKLTKITLAGQTLISLANCTESTAPVLTVELWEVFIPSTQKPFIPSFTNTYGTAVEDSVSWIEVTNVTSPYFENATTSAANGNSVLTAQVTIGSSTNVQREFYAFSALASSLASAGTNLPSGSLVGTNSPAGNFYQYNQGVSVSSTTGVQGYLMAGSVERAPVSNTDTVGFSYTIANSNPLSACTIGVAVIPLPPKTTTTTTTSPKTTTTTTATTTTTTNFTTSTTTNFTTTSTTTSSTVTANSSVYCPVGWPEVCNQGISSPAPPTAPFSGIANDIIGTLAFAEVKGVTGTVDELFVYSAIATNTYYIGFYDNATPHNLITRLGPFSIVSGLNSIPVAGPVLSGTVWIGYTRAITLDPYEATVANACTDESVLALYTTPWPATITNNGCVDKTIVDAVWFETGTTTTTTTLLTTTSTTTVSSTTTTFLTTTTTTKNSGFNVTTTTTQFNSTTATSVVTTGTIVISVCANTGTGFPIELFLIGLLVMIAFLVLGYVLRASTAFLFSGIIGIILLAASALTNFQYSYTSGGCVTPINGGGFFAIIPLLLTIWAFIAVWASSRSSFGNQ